jgi:LacI family transcriptional regulator
VTLAEVARRAGVSAATVSRVMSGRTVVSPAIRDRVMRVVREVNYAPNVHAQALAGGRSRTLGMIVSNIENPFFLGVFVALEEFATQQDYEVLVEHTGYRRERLVDSIRSMLKRRVEGLAVIVSEMDQGLIDELAAQDVPVVFYDVGRPARNITSIRVRYDKGTQRIAEYLYSLGHRRFGFIGHHAGLGPLEERKRTFVEVMERFGKGVRFASASGMDSPGGGAMPRLSCSVRPYSRPRFCARTTTWPSGCCGSSGTGDCARRRTCLWRASTTSRSRNTCAPRSPRPGFHSGRLAN